MTQPLQYGLSGDRSYSRYYRHTGKVTFAGVATTMAVGVPAAVVAGLVYAYADTYSPIVYLNLLLTFLFGVGMGALCGAILKWGKVRNVPVALAVAGTMTAVAYYVCWAVWVYNILSDIPTSLGAFTMVDLGLNPKFLWRAINAINQVGTWAIGRSTSTSKARANVSDGFLWVVWLGEAAIIFGGALVVSRKFIGELPFCESCDAWCSKPTTIAVLGVSGNPGVVKAEMEAGRYEPLAALRNGQTAGFWWEVRHHRCWKCDKFHTVSVFDVVRTIDKKGNETTKAKPVVDRLIISTEDLARLKAALEGNGASVGPYGRMPPA